MPVNKGVEHDIGLRNLRSIGWIGGVDTSYGGSGTGDKCESGENFHVFPFMSALLGRSGELRFMTGRRIVDIDFLQSSQEWKNIPSSSSVTDPRFTHDATPVAFKLADSKAVDNCRASFTVKDQLRKRFMSVFWQAPSGVVRRHPMRPCWRRGSAPACSAASLAPLWWRLPPICLQPSCAYGSWQSSRLPFPPVKCRAFQSH